MTMMTKKSFSLLLLLFVPSRSIGGSSGIRGTSESTEPISGPVTDKHKLLRGSSTHKQQSQSKRTKLQSDRSNKIQQGRNGDNNNKQPTLNVHGSAIVAPKDVRMKHTTSRRQLQSDQPWSHSGGIPDYGDFSSWKAPEQQQGGEDITGGGNTLMDDVVNKQGGNGDQPPFSPLEQEEDQSIFGPSQVEAEGSSVVRPQTVDEEEEWWFPLDPAEREEFAEGEEEDEPQQEEEERPYNVIGNIASGMFASVVQAGGNVVTSPTFCSITHICLSSESTPLPTPSPTPAPTAAQGVVASLFCSVTQARFCVSQESAPFPPAVPPNTPPPTPASSTAAPSQFSESQVPSSGVQQSFGDINSATPPTSAPTTVPDFDDAHFLYQAYFFKTGYMLETPAWLNSFNQMVFCRLFGTCFEIPEEVAPTLPDWEDPYWRNRLCDVTSICFPTIAPSPMPTISPMPSPVPSVAPSSFPTSEPTTASPTPDPTPGAVEVVLQPTPSRQTPQTSPPQTWIPRDTPKPTSAGKFETIFGQREPNSPLRCRFTRLC